MIYLKEYKKFNIPSIDYTIDVNDIWIDVSKNVTIFEKIFNSLKGCTISFKCERSYNPPDFIKNHSCYFHKVVKNPPPIPNGSYINPNYEFVKALHYGVVEDVKISFGGRYYLGKIKRGYRVLIKFENVALYHRLDDIFHVHNEPQSYLKTYLTSKRFDLL